MTHANATAHDELEYEADRQFASGDDRWDDDQPQTTPARQRRRRFTPLTLAFAAVILLAGGFLGGVEVQKSQGNAGASAATRADAPPGNASGAGGAGASSDATVGTVAFTRGGTLYLTDSSGSTIRVKTTANSKISRTANTDANTIRPGDTVTVQGTKSKSASITATQITATAKGVSAASGFPGGSARAAGGSSGSTSPDASGSGSSTG
jgi:hypothetical protein